jgi:hypothetical protein
MTGATSSGRRSPERIRCLGAGIGFFLGLAVAAVLVVVAAALPADWSTPRLLTLLAAFGAFVGSPVGAWLGWREASAAADPSRTLRETVSHVTWQAIVLGALLIAVWGSAAPGDDLRGTDAGLRLDTVLSDVFSPIAIRMAWAGFALVIGLILFSIPAALLAAPIVAIWALLMRRTVPRR